MKITIMHDGANAHKLERMGWAKVFQYCGHEVSFWDIRGKSAFDQFDEFLPDLLLGQSYNLSNSAIQVLHENPHIKIWLKLGDWGKICEKYDLNKYQILVASDSEIEKVNRLQSKMDSQILGGAHYWIGREEDSHGNWKNIGVRPFHMTLGADVFSYTNSHEVDSFKCDIGIVSGYWPYKAIILDRWLLPLMKPDTKLNIKVFGYNWGTPFYCGQIDEIYEKYVLRSQSISLNLHEPHALDNETGLELNERSFKLLSNKCFVISDRPNDLANHIFNNDEIVFAKNPQEFESLIYHYLRYPHEKEPYRDRGYQKVIKSETYFHRIARLMKTFFDDEQEKVILDGYERIKKELSL